MDLNNNEGGSIIVEPEHSSPISGFDLFKLVLPVIAHPCSFVACVWQIVADYMNREIWYGTVTLLVFVLPGMITEWMSLHTREKGPVTSAKRQIYEAPESEDMWKNRPRGTCEKIIEIKPPVWFKVLFKLDLFLRNSHVLCYAYQNRTLIQKGGNQLAACYYKKMLEEKQDAGWLSLVGQFPGTALQHVIQLGRPLDSQSTKNLVFLIVSSCITMVSLASSLSSYNLVCRKLQANTAQVGRWGAVISYLWHLFVIAHRILLIVVGLDMSLLYTLVYCLCCWFGWTIWIYNKEEDVANFACNENRPEHSKRTVKEIVRTLVCAASFGVVDIFCYMNLKEGPTLYRYLARYLLFALEMALLILLRVWFGYQTLARNSILDVLLIASTVLFLFGIAMMVMYYRFFHPTVSWGNPKELGRNFNDQGCIPELTSQTMDKDESLIESSAGFLSVEHAV